MYNERIYFKSLSGDQVKAKLLSALRECGVFGKPRLKNGTIVDVQRAISVALGLPTEDVIVEEDVNDCRLNIRLSDEAIDAHPDDITGD